MSSSAPVASANDRELATIELLGALAYGQLRAFEATARTVPHAPTTKLADELASFAVGEHERYIRLRDELARRTELPVAVMDRQRHRFDDYFDHAPLTDWFGASMFFAIGLPMASDFGRAIAPVLPADLAKLVVETLDRGAAEALAAQQARAILTDEAARQRARHLLADMLGRALTGFQAVMDDTDALMVLLDADRRPGESGEQRVKRLAITVLEGHRRRTVALGLEDLDDDED
ncbi:MAG: ferritin-like fold-containing protein [Nitriliruptoraceae bacterium]